MPERVQLCLEDTQTSGDVQLSVLFGRINPIEDIMI